MAKLVNMRGLQVRALTWLTDFVTTYALVHLWLILPCADLHCRHSELRKQGT